MTPPGVEEFHSKPVEAQAHSEPLNEPQPFGGKGLTLTSLFLKNAENHKEERLHFIANTSPFFIRLTWTQFVKLYLFAHQLHIFSTSIALSQPYLVLL